MTAKTVEVGITRAFSWRRGLAAFGVALLVVIAIAAGFAVGYQQAFANQVIPGVTVDGVSIGGMDRAAAESRLRAALPDAGSGTLVLRSSTGDASVPFSKLGRTYDYGAILEDALGVGHGADLPTMVAEDLRALVRGEPVTPQLTYDRAALDAAVASVAGTHDAGATNASVSLDPSGNFVLRPAAQGVAVNRQAAVATAGVELLAPGASVITVTLQTSQVAPAVTTEEAAAALQAANAMTGQPLALTVSTDPKFTQTIAPATLRTWIVFGTVPPAPAPASPAPAVSASSPPAASPAPTSPAPSAAPASAAPASASSPAIPSPQAPFGSPAPAPSAVPALASPGLPAASNSPAASPAAAAYGPWVGTPAARTAIAALAPKVDRAPADATFLIGDGSVIGVLSSHDGTQLDVDGSLNAISLALAARAQGVPTGGALLAVTPVAPTVSTEEARKTAPLMKIVGSWTTHFIPGIGNYNGKNISIPAARIDGYVVAPGAWFDFWKVVGVPTFAEGYGMGGAIINGHTEETGAIAGGICSTSTTLFNAALRAGYQIGDRANHYYYISRYPVGLDATVAMGTGWEQDMTWRNDTAYPVLIHAINGYGTVTFQLFSVDPQRTVTLSTPIVKNYTYATTNYEKVTTLKPGQVNQVEYASNGFDSWVTRVVRDASGAIIHQETYYSHYATVNALIEVGVASLPSPSPTPHSPSPSPSPSPSASPAP
jgi:vancomycin resistance protein YoaR